MNTVFLEPLDVLFLRGNKLFGEAGSFGESLVPPWPSVAAGALRSRLLADAGVDRVDFANGHIEHPELGTPSTPGAFTVTAFHLAQRRANGAVDLLMAPPADLVVSKGDEGGLHVRALAPTALNGRSLASSAPLPLMPVLPEPTRSKPEGGLWLTESGWRTYLAGLIPGPDQFLPASALWTLDTRVGVGLSAEMRRADNGKLFAVQAVAMVKRGMPLPLRGGFRQPADYDVGFLAAVAGAQTPRSGTLRLGGDGRAAAVHAIDKPLPQPDYAAIVRAGRCRLVLTTPGLFVQGWLPTGMSQRVDGSYRFELHGVSGRFVCAAVSRTEVVSGWDLAQRRPKPAQSAAPAGSVYWLDELQTSPEALAKLVERGLWSDICEDEARRAEGFNRVAIAPWTQF